MKKIFITIASVLALSMMSSCDDVLDLTPPDEVIIDEAIKTEDDVNKFLMGAYLKSSSGGFYGAHLFFLGDLLGDSMFRSNTHQGGFTSLIMSNFDPTNSDEVSFYRGAYDIIQNTNFVIYNELEDTPLNKSYKAEAHALRAMVYFNLVNYYASSPKSNMHQDLGVPIALYPYNANEKIPRSSVAEVYDLIINDLNYAIENGVDVPTSKIYLSKTAAKLFLSRVYITRQATGDAQKALDLTNSIISSSPSVFRLATNAEYLDYFAANRDALSENQPETVWELDLKTTNNPGVNNALGVFYSFTGPKKALMAKRTFYDSFKSTDIRTKLFLTTGAPNTDVPAGVWIRKHERASSGGNYTRNTKVLRFSEAYLNRIEALYQLGNNAEALAKLNEFAEMRLGYTYNGTNLLKDILDERNKEFFAEGQRFLDLKRYNLPINKGTNCPNNCDISANSKYMVLPFSLSQLVLNPLAVQHPLWQ